MHEVILCIVNGEPSLMCPTYYKGLNFDKRLWWLRWWIVMDGLLFFFFDWSWLVNNRRHLKRCHDGEKLNKLLKDSFHVFLSPMPEWLQSFRPSPCFDKYESEVLPLKSFNDKSKNTLYAYIPKLQLKQWMFNICW